VSFRKAWIAGVSPGTLGVLYLTMFPAHYHKAGWIAVGIACAMVALSLLAVARGR
jgi:hypothetical protein